MNRARAKSGCAICAMLLVAGCGPGPGGDDPGWPRWRGANGDGVSRETDWNPAAIAGEPRVLWKAKVGVGYSSVAVKGRRLYALGARDGGTRVTCLDAETGREIWHYVAAGSKSTQSTPTLDADSVYALSPGGLLLCLDAGSGKLRWQRDLVDDLGAEKLAYGYAQSPVVEGKLLLLNARTHGIALDKRTGKTVWSSPSGRNVLQGFYATPVVYDRKGARCALFFGDTALVAVEATTGKRLWSHPLTERLESPKVADPIVDGTRVLLETGTAVEGSLLLETSGDDPKVLWRNEQLWTQGSTPVLVGGFLYGAAGEPDDSRTQVQCVEWATGRLVWERLGKPIALTAVGNRLLILENEGRLCVAEATPSGYKELSSVQLPRTPMVPMVTYTPPVLYRGRIYCRTLAELFCLDARR